MDIPPQLRSDLAQHLLYLDGQPFSLGDYPFYHAIYDGNYQGMLLKSGRQVAKSTTLCNFLISEGIGTSHFRSLYVSPSQEQTRKFSNTRVGKVCLYSPLIKQYWVDASELSQRTMLRMFRNGSEISFTYALDDPDRARGNTADRCCYDEVQDILYEPVIPVINECMGNSEYGYETYAGTPKTMENTIEYLWSISTQNEWIMKCDGCGRYSFIDNAKAVGKVGPVCVKCDHALNPRNGQWYSFKPEATLTGFHIPQLILPRNAEQPNRWQRILTKLARYSDTKFKNEVLGISDALGARIISKQELEALCEDYDIYRQPSPGINMEYRHVVGGVDWSGGGTEGVSRTVVWIWAVTKNHQLRTLYYRVYPITSPVSIVDDVAEALQAHHVELVIGDRGEGHLANDLLAQRLGSNRVSQVMYGAQARTISWNEKGLFYTADRTTLMDNYFMVLKRQGVIFPRLSCMLEPITDILNIYEEVTVNGKKVWRHAPTQPDDCFHAQLFGWLAAKVLLMDLTFTG